MPAIHLPRLQKQVEDLAKYYADADKFSRQLEILFDYYGDKTRRPSQKIIKTSQLPSENIPSPVFRQIIQQLTPYAENTPHAILNLCRGLWRHFSLDYRFLAAQLLGKIAISHATETLELVEIWSRENKERQLLQTLSTSSLSVIRDQKPDLLLAWIGAWLAPDEATTDQTEVSNLQKLGLNALIPFVENPALENLPRIYTLITPLVRNAPRTLRPYLVDLLIPLAARSPQEVAFVFRSQLETEPTPDLKWLGRRVLPHLPEENQTRLRPLVTRQREE